MKEKYLKRPTTYVVQFWNTDGSEIIKEEVYPMHIFSLEDVISKLKGKESECDIYESRYYKKRNKYLINGRIIIWDGYNWVTQMQPIKE